MANKKYGIGGCNYCKKAEIAGKNLHTLYNIRNLYGF